MYKFNSIQAILSTWHTVLYITRHFCVFAVYNYGNTIGNSMTLEKIPSLYFLTASHYYLFEFIDPNKSGQYDFLWI